jgi:magnesium-transporting ATPase (P-type)
MNKVFVVTSAIIGACIFAQSAFAQCFINGESVPCGETDPVATTFLIIAAIIVPFLMIGFVFAIVVTFIVFWVWMIVDAAQNEKENELVAWILVLVFLSWIGAIVYYFARKRPRDKTKKNIAKQDISNNA